MSAHWRDTPKTLHDTDYDDEVHLYIFITNNHCVLVLYNLSGCFVSVSLISTISCSSGCLFYKRGAGRLSVRGTQPDRLSAILGMQATSCNNAEGSQFMGQFAGCG